MKKGSRGQGIKEAQVFPAGKPPHNFLCSTSANADRTAAPTLTSALEDTGTGGYNDGEGLGRGIVKGIDSPDDRELNMVSPDYGEGLRFPVVTLRGGKAMVYLCGNRVRKIVKKLLTMVIVMPALLLAGCSSFPPLTGSGQGGSERDSALQFAEQGAVLGFDGFGIYVISISTGKRTTLIQRYANPAGIRVAAPAYDVESDTLYYVDGARNAIMKWQSGNETPVVLYALTDEQAWHIRWLLLTPDNKGLVLELCPSNKGLIEIDTVSGRDRTIVKYEYALDACPMWLGNGKLLFMQGAYSRKEPGRIVYAPVEVDTETGTVTKTFALPEDHYGNPALSASKTRLFLKTYGRTRDVQHEGYTTRIWVTSGKLLLYEFPSMKLIREIRDADLPQKVTYDNVCFAGDRYLIMARGPYGGVLAKALYLVDLDSEKLRARKISSYGMQSYTFLPKVPQWRNPVGR